MKPTIGRIVIYKTTEADRGSFDSSRLHGSKINIQYELPAIIVAVWSDTCVNLKVFVDGFENDLWKTSIIQGTEEGQWSWPEIVYQPSSEISEPAILPLESEEEFISRVNDDILDISSDSPNDEEYYIGKEESNPITGKFEIDNVQVKNFKDDDDRPPIESVYLYHNGELIGQSHKPQLNDNDDTSYITIQM